MAADLAEMTSIISAELRRGTSLDSLIPTRIRMAGRRIERAFDLEYMRKYKDDQVVTQSDPGFSWPTGFKHETFVRYTLETGEYQYLVRVHPEDVTQVLDSPTEEISAYWSDDIAGVLFDNLAPRDLTVEFGYFAYTDPWPTEGAHWLFSNAEDLILAETMLLFSGHIRDTKVLQLYSSLRADAITGLDIAQNLQRWENTDARMQYQ